MRRDPLPMDAIDELLLDWYAWQCHWEPVRGYGNGAGFARDFRSSRQWMTLDERSEDVDRHLCAAIGRAVDPLVCALNLRLRVAVTTAVRNFAAEAIVWVNPRWPETQDRDYAQAKAALEPLMRARGLLALR